MKGKAKYNPGGICPGCGCITKNIGRHLRRGRCSEQGIRGGKYNSEKIVKQYTKDK